MPGLFLVEFFTNFPENSHGNLRNSRQGIVRIEEGCKVYLENPSDKKAPEKQFIFDSAYDGNSSNETIYGDICYSLVESVLEGYNSTIFAYGQTGKVDSSLTVRMRSFKAFVAHLKSC
jgi:hypothetical protein